MRPITLLIIILLISCSDSSVDISRKITNTLWVNQDLKFDTLRLDTTSMIVHGSGTIIFFDTASIFKSFSNDFYSNNDSLVWGEPGIVMDYGNWKIDRNKLVVSKQLIERTFSIPNQKTSTVQLDTFHIIRDTLIMKDGARFIPVKLISKELRELLNRDWSKWREKKDM